MFWVLNEAFQFQGLVSDIIEGDWLENWQEANSFTLSFINSEHSNTRQLLKVNHYVYDKSSKVMMIINKVRYSDSDKKIYVYGQGVEAILNWRIVRVENSLLKCEAKLFKLVQDNLRALPVMLGTQNNYSEEYDGNGFETSTLESAVYELCKQGEFDIKLTYDETQKKFLLTSYRGEDRTYKNDIGGHVFSADRGVLGDLELVFDYTQYGDMALCKVDNTWLTTGNTATGGKEIYISSGLSKRNDEGDESYHTRLKRYMQKEHKKLQNQIELTATVRNEDILQHISLGDKVTCKSLEYGFVVDTRIKSIRKRFNRGTIEIDITFDETVERS